MRHFFHGDIATEQTENSAARQAVAENPGAVVVFCARCDLFEPEVIVRAHPPEMRARRVRGRNRLVSEPYDGPARLEYDARRYRKATADYRKRNPRPEGAPNIFTAPPPPEAHHARS